jgi:Fe-S cluster assembly protein SufD
MGSLKAMAEAYPDLVGKYYGKLAPATEHATTALNTAFVQDGLFIYVPTDTHNDGHPITQVVHLSISPVDLMSHRRLLIVLEEGASLSLLSCDHSLDAVHFLHTQVAEVFVGKGATLNLYDMEETHEQTTRLSNLYLQQEADSTANLCTLTLHNGTTHNRVRARFVGEGAHLTLNGLVLGGRKQHTMTDTLIDHAVPRCTADQLYKYVLDEESVGQFIAKTLVRQDAQQTRAQQTAKALCLTRTARFLAEPQLEIYADDVKCGHGAGIGQLNEQAMFYMQQRGIGQEEARHLLLSAFLSDIIADIHISTLADRLRWLVDKRLRGELIACEGCHQPTHTS